MNCVVFAGYPAVAAAETMYVFSGSRNRWRPLDQMRNRIMGVLHMLLMISVQVRGRPRVQVTIDRRCVVQYVI